jgi:predicted alpha/beta hydrolase
MSQADVSHQSADVAELPSGRQNDAPEPVAITTRDGEPLVGRLFLPDGNPVRAIVLHPAVGAVQDFYARFAAWLATEHRAAVLTYDYRDFGASATRPLRQSRASMAIWGAIDQDAALDALCARFPALPVWVVGHSHGGMYVPFHAQAERVERIVTIAAGLPYWLKHPASYMPAVLAFWWLIGPAATALLGYLPGRAIGLGADLPPEVYWQWRRWCLKPGYYRADWGRALPVPDLTRVTCDVTLVALADDPMMPPERVRALATSYPAARVTHQVIAPSDICVPAIGHMRLFSERNAAAWPLVFAPA